MVSISWLLLGMENHERSQHIKRKPFAYDVIQCNERFANRNHRVRGSHISNYDHLYAVKLQMVTLLSSVKRMSLELRKVNDSSKPDWVHTVNISELFTKSRKRKTFTSLLLQVAPQQKHPFTTNFISTVEMCGSCLNPQRTRTWKISFDSYIIRTVKWTNSKDAVS